MDLSSRMEAEKELGRMGAEQLRREQMAITYDLERLQAQIGDLAFNNYRTYANASRTTQQCQQTFSEINGILGDMGKQLPNVGKEFRNFIEVSKQTRRECELLESASAVDWPTKKILEMPELMDLCIRTGSYDAAYALTNFGIGLQQSLLTMADGAYKTLFTAVADRLISARSFLLEELFNKFAGPLDLSDSMQVVKNVRKIPYLTNPQLRVSVLQYRDIYLDKQILDASSNAEFTLQAIEIYRTCMYDTMVLYMAVFPENEVVRRDASVDPRWENWPASGRSAVLSEWAIRNVHRLLELIERADMKAQVDMSAVWNKLMAFGASFGRMGLDFRPLIVDSMMSMVKKRFSNAVRHVTQKLVNEVKRLDVHGGDSTWGGPNAPNESTAGPPQPSAELSMCDDFAVYGNGIIEALNNLRYSLSPALLPFVLQTLRESLLSVFSWLAAYKTSAHFARAVRILAVHLIDFLNKCIIFYFPYSTVQRLYGSSFPRHEYESACDLNVRKLLDECDGGAGMKEVLRAELEPPKVEDDVLESLLAKHGNGPLDNNNDGVVTIPLGSAMNGIEETNAPSAQSTQQSASVEETLNSTALSASESYESSTALAASEGFGGSTALTASQSAEGSTALSASDSFAGSTALAASESAEASTALSASESFGGSTALTASESAEGSTALSASENTGGAPASSTSDHSPVEILFSTESTPSDHVSSPPTDDVPAIYEEEDYNVHRFQTLSTVPEVTEPHTISQPTASPGDAKTESLDGPPLSTISSHLSEEMNQPSSYTSNTESIIEVPSVDSLVVGPTQASSQADTDVEAVSPVQRFATDSTAISELEPVVSSGHSDVVGFDTDSTRLSSMDVANTTAASLSTADIFTDPFETAPSSARGEDVRTAETYTTANSTSLELLGPSIANSAAPEPTQPTETEEEPSSQGWGWGDEEADDVESSDVATAAEVEISSEEEEPAPAVPVPKKKGGKAD
ncbi:unnamed protein product, partial [Mesorhabditis spiculigera]